MALKIKEFELKNEAEAVNGTKNERLQLDKRKDRDLSEDKVYNLLLNVIDYSFLKNDEKNNNGGVQRVMEQNIGGNHNMNQSVNLSNFNSSNRGLRLLESTPKIININKKQLNLSAKPRMLPDYI